MPMPNIDPNLYQELQNQSEINPQANTMSQGEVNPQGMPQPQVNTMPQGMPQPQANTMPQGMPQEPQGDPIEEAKKALGLEEQQRQLEEMQRRLMDMEAEKAKAQLQAKYPNVPFNIVEEEIKKVEDVNPELAALMKVKPEAMEIAFKAALASIEPQEKPDKITEGEGGGGNDDSIEEAIKKGKADELTLGEYILKAGS